MHARRIFVLLLLLSTFVLPSCIPLDNPLSEPEKAKPDTRLFGAWKAVNKKERDQEIGLLLIGKSGLKDAPPGIMKFTITGLNKDNQIEPSKSFYFFVTSLGNNNYVNILADEGIDKAQPPAWEQRKIEGYFLDKYTVEGDKLTWWSGNPKAVEAAIQKGQLKGKIEKGFLSVATLTGGEELAKFLATDGEKLFFPTKEDYRIELTRIK